MRFYLATRLENALLARDVIAELRRWGWEPTYDWTAHGPIRGEGSTKLIEVAHAELRGVLDADVVVVLLPGGRGTHTELGAALAAGKRVTVWADCDTLLRDDGNTCAFYWHPCVSRIVGPVGSLLEYLRTVVVRG